VGVHIDPTPLSWIALALAALGMSLAIVARQPIVAIQLGVVLAGTLGFLVYQGYRLGRTIWHAVEITFQSLPLDPLRPERNGKMPQG
jgi:hypothetical protein